MRHTFLYFFFIIAFGASAQAELTIEKLKNYYARVQPEYIHGHVNKTSLLRGEHLLFKLWINSTSRGPHNLSVIVYAEILDTDKKVLARQKLRVTNGAADGAFKIPAQLLPGNYSFRAYTLWMNNVGEWSFFHQSIFIGNETANISAASDAIHPIPRKNIRMIQPAEGQFEVHIDTTLDGFVIAHHMGRVLYSNNILTAEKKTHKFSDAGLAGSIEVGLFDEVGKLIDEISYRADDDSDDLVITTSKSTFKPREKIEITIALRDDVEVQGDFSIAVKKKSTTVSKAFSHNFSGSVPWAFLHSNSQPLSFKREMSILPVVAESLNPIPFAKPVLAVTKGSTDDLSPERIKEIYELPAEVRELPFMKLPADNTYSPDKYLELPTLEDFFQEVVPEARVKKNGGTKAIFLRNIENPNRIFFYSKSPLLLLNNKIVTNQENFLALSPATIESLDFSWRTETINDTGIQTLANTGVVSVFTKASDATGRQDVYNDFARPVVFTVPNYGQNSSENLPDFRSTLFWNPSIKVTSTARISFYLSDDLGDFTIEVSGETDDGRILRQSRDFVIATEQ